MLASEYFNSAARIARILGIKERPGRTLATEETAEFLEIANGILDSLNSQSLMIYDQQRVVFNMVAGQQTYLIGTGSPDWNIPRPPRIDKAGLVIASNQPYPLELPIDVLTIDQWKNVPTKALTSTLSFFAWYEPSFAVAAPYGKFNLYPIPTQVNQIALYPWVQFSRFANAGVTVDFPPGYERLLKFLIAIDAWLRYHDTPVPADLRTQAAVAMSEVRSINAPIIDLTCDIAARGDRSLGQWNWITGDYQRR